MWLPETRPLPWGNFGRGPGSSGPWLAQCCSREAQLATAEGGAARRSCLSSAPYVLLPALGAGCRFARLGTGRDSRGSELRRRPGPSPAGGEAPGRRPCLLPESKRLAGECGCARPRAHRAAAPDPSGRIPPLSGLHGPGLPRPGLLLAAGWLGPLPTPRAGVVTPAALSPLLARFEGSLTPASSLLFAPGAWVAQLVPSAFAFLASF